MGHIPLRALVKLVRTSLITASRTILEAEMTFCDTCQSLPIRNILRLLQGDTSVRDKFQWFRLPWAVTNREDEYPFVRWHESLAGLQNGARNCAFCQVISSHLSSSYHYHNNYKDGDITSLWLQARALPHVTVYLGNTKPEMRLSGNFWYNTTPGTVI